MKRKTKASIGAWSKVAASAITPWVAWSMGQKEMKVAVIESISLALIAISSVFATAPKDVESVL